VAAAADDDDMGEDDVGNDNVGVNDRQQRR
jgi:hypothetical protein